MKFYLLMIILLCSCLTENVLRVKYENTTINIYDAKCPGYECNLIKFRNKGKIVKILTQCGGKSRLHVSKETYDYYGIGVTEKVNSTTYLSYNDTIIVNNNSMIKTISPIEKVAFEKTSDYMKDKEGCNKFNIKDIIGFIDKKDILKW